MHTRRGNYPSYGRKADVVSLGELVPAEIVTVDADE